jgi:hypothetical protein
MRDHAQKCLALVPEVDLGMAYNIYMYTLSQKLDLEFARNLCSLLTSSQENELESYFENDQYIWQTQK